MNESELQELSHALTQSWNLSNTGDAADRDALRVILAERVAFLMRHDLQRLLSAMYLLDIPEARFNAAMRNDDVDVAATELGGIILDREQQKIDTRNAYAKKRDATRIEKDPRKK